MSNFPVSGDLAEGGVVTVTIDEAAYDVIVTATGATIWVSTDGTTPVAGNPNTARRVAAGDPKTVPVLESPGAIPTVIKLISEGDASYVIALGSGPEGNQTAGLPDLADGAVGDVLAVVQDPVPGDAVLTIRAGEGMLQPTPPDGGTWTITFDGDTTTPLGISPGLLLNSYLAALEALPSIGAGNVSVSGSMDAGAVVVTFIGDLGNQPIAAERLTVDGTDLTGPEAPYTPFVEQTALGAVGGEKTYGLTDPSGASVPEFPAEPGAYNLVAENDPAAVNAAFQLAPSDVSFDGGTFILSYDGDPSAAIPFDVEAGTTVLGGTVQFSGPLGAECIVEFVAALAAGAGDEEALTADGSGLTGPDSPYTIDVVPLWPGVAPGPMALSWVPVPEVAPG